MAYSVTASPFRATPINQVTPFTYRDGMTFLEILERLKEYVHFTLVPEINRHLEHMQQHMDGVEDKYRQDLADYIATVEDRFAELAETFARLAVDEYLADPTTIDNAVALKIQEIESATRSALDSLYAPLHLVGWVEQLQDQMGNAETGIQSIRDVIDSGRLSPGTLKETIQTTPVDPSTFLPTANVVFKRTARDAYYEVMRVSCNGQYRPGVVRRAYAHDFHKSSPKGDGFVIPNGEGESLSSFAARTQADVVANNTGWQTADVWNKWALRGPQITDGVIYRDFETNSNRGRHTIGVHADGKAVAYRVDEGWTAQLMIEDGVVDTFGFGPLLVMNNYVMDVESLSWSNSLTDGRMSGRTVLGWGANGDVILITVVGESTAGIGIGGNEMGLLAQQEGCRNAILLDGGGSTQAVANGVTYHPSSDNDQERLVGDALLIYARMTQMPSNTIGRGSESLQLADGFKAQSGEYWPAAIVRGGMVSLLGSVSPSSGLFPANEWVVIGRVPDKARPRATLGSGAILPCSSGADMPAKVQIRAYGEMSIKTPVETGYINLFGVSYGGW